MDIRPLAAADLDALRAFVFFEHVERSAYDGPSRAAQTADLPTDFPDLVSPAAFAALSLGAWGARDAASGGTLAGACGLKRGEAGSSDMVLSYLFVAPRAQRQGLGRALLRAALARAQQLAGAGSGARLRLLTLEGVYGPAVRLYESEGFTLLRRVPPSAEEGACPFYTLLHMDRALAPAEAAPAPAAAAAAAVAAAEASAAEAQPPPSLQPLVRVQREAGGPRVLVLHGYSQNAQDFLARYKPLLDRKLKFCTLVAPSAPFSIDCAGGAARTWWFNRAPDPTRGGAYEGLGTSRALLLALAAEQGPFHGVLGFSQGAVLAHQLLAEGSLPGCQWVVLASGFPSLQCPPQPPAEPAAEGAAAPTAAHLLPTPSLHLSSSADTTVAPALHAALAARFASPILLHHEHGHALVQRAEHCNAVAAFIREHTRL
jgi:GNAT superfamily N-acetyltransferase/predicted esterase